MKASKEKAKITVELQQFSNFHSNRHTLVIQAYCSLNFKWEDTIHGAHSVKGAEQKALEVWQDDNRWVDGNRTALRIVKNKKR